jgi:hypothetical protein
MLLLERSVTTGLSVRNADRPRRRRTRIIVPSPVRGNVPEFLDEVPFGALGRLRKGAVHQPRPDHTTDVGRWLALQSPRVQRSTQILNCVDEHPGWFKAWSSVKLADSSLRLPKDEVMMYVVEEPTFVPGDPPRSVLERWELAIQMYPQAIGYWMEPFFDFPLDANAKALTLAQLSSSVDEQWDSLFAKARHWGWMFRLEHAVEQWAIRRRERRERRLRSELYVEMLLQREQRQLFEFAADRVASGSVGRRRAARNAALEAHRIDLMGAEAWIEERLQTADPLIRRQIEEMESDIAELGDGVRAKGRMTQDQAQTRLSRREFSVAVMLGLVVFPTGRFERRDPILGIQIPGENVLRLVGHWDRWMATVNGKPELCTFVHV